MQQRMTKPLLAILLLLPLSVSAGEVDGRAISCKPPPQSTDHQHFEFEAGTVVRWRVLMDETTAVLKEFNTTSYVASPHRITWEMGDREWSLNRATLELEKLFSGKKISDNDDRSKNLFRWSCEVYTSSSEFKSMLESLKLDKQREINEQMKDNKI